MIRETTYGDGVRSATISLDRVDTWLQANETAFRFPTLIEFDDDVFYLTVNKSPREGPMARSEYAMRSDDAGESWREIGDHALVGAGGLGRLRDGTIVTIDHDTVEAHARAWDPSEGPFHTVMQQRDPTFRFRRWSGSGAALAAVEFKVEGLPWSDVGASYQCYATILEQPDGELLAALETLVGPPIETPPATPGGRPGFKLEFRTFIVRSRGGGERWEFVRVFDPTSRDLTFGPGARPIEQGFCEADLAGLPNGEILCVMRTGSTAPLFQSRSQDGGQTWSMPVSTGWHGVRPRLRVMSNGLLVCSAGRGPYGHPQVTHVMLSLDGTGALWEAPFAFHVGPSCSYTGNMERDGQLHVVHSAADPEPGAETSSQPSMTINRSVFDVRLEPS